MRRLAVLVLIFVPACWAGLAALRAPCAFADGDGKGTATGAKKDALAELTEKELAFLREKIPGWDKLDPRKKQMMARNVLRLRNMPAGQRKDFKERLERLKQRKDQMRHGSHMLANRSLARAAKQALGSAFEHRLHRSDISDHVFEMSFSRAFWNRVAESAFPSGEPVPADALPQNAPERMVRAYGSVRARWAATEDAAERGRLLKKLGWMYGSMRAHQLRHDLAQSDIRSPEAYVAAVAAKVRETWPREFAASVSDPDALLSAAENEEVRRSLRRLMRRDGRLLRDESALVVRLLERLVAHNQRNEEEAGKEADALIRRVLLQDLRLPQEVVDAMPPRTEPQARADWYAQVTKRLLGQRGRPRPGAPDGARRGRERGGMPRRPMERPAGVSDAGWAAFEKARAEGSLRTWMRSRPEGLADEDYDLLRRALKKHFEPRRRGAGVPPGERPPPEGSGDK